MILRPANDHGEDFDYTKSVYYQVFLTDSKEVIQNMMHGIIYGKVIIYQFTPPYQ